MNEREPYLDGLRGFSALAVAVAHAQFFRYGNNDLVTQVRDVLSKLGTVGVQIFFVISGYIIVTLLLREQRETGRICIRHSMPGVSFASSRRCCATSVSWYSCAFLATTEGCSIWRQRRF
jgi:uncharacterized membrane protein YcfT